MYYMSATTVEEMYAKEVFTFRPVNESRYVILRYADIVCVEASNNNSVFHMADGSSFTVASKNNHPAFPSPSGSASGRSFTEVVTLSGKVCLPLQSIT